MPIFRTEVAIILRSSRQGADAPVRRSLLSRLSDNSSSVLWLYGRRRITQCEVCHQKKMMFFFLFLFFQYEATITM